MGSANPPTPEGLIDEWNARVSVGDEVSYAGLKGGDKKIYNTRTAAWVLSGHTAVVMLDGKNGCVDLEHCEPLVDSAEKKGDVDDK